MPAAHAEHTDAYEKIGMTKPAGHSMQSVIPDAEYRPSGHAVQVVDPGVDVVPDGQRLHTLIGPVTAAYVPAAQGLHWVLPAGE